MGPLLYVRSVVDRNVVMLCMTVQWIKEGCTNPRYQVFHEAEFFFTVARKICGSLV